MDSKVALLEIRRIHLLAFVLLIYLVGTIELLTAGIKTRTPKGGVELNYYFGYY
jgi:hypothetical protein